MDSVTAHDPVRVHKEDEAARRSDYGKQRLQGCNKLQPAVLASPDISTSAACYNRPCLRVAAL